MGLSNLDGINYIVVMKMMTLWASEPPKAFFVFVSSLQLLL